MSALTFIDRSTIQLGMIIVSIHDGYINIGKVIDISPLEITKCWAHESYANAIYDLYVRHSDDRHVNAIYLCPEDIVSKLVFRNLQREIMTLEEEAQP